MPGQFSISEHLKTLTPGQLAARAAIFSRFARAARTARAAGVLEGLATCCLGLAIDDAAREQRARDHGRASELHMADDIAP